MILEVNDVFRHTWVVDHMRFGGISRVFFDGKMALSKADIEAELATRDKDVLVEWFQSFIEQSYMLSWADTDYMLELYDLTYKMIDGNMVRYDWFKFTVDSENIVSLADYDAELAAMLDSAVPDE